jgi:hypothetical protein
VDILFEDARLNWTLGKLTVDRDGKTDEHTPPAPGIDEIVINAVKTGDGSAIRTPLSRRRAPAARSRCNDRSAAESRPWPSAKSAEAAGCGPNQWVDGMRAPRKGSARLDAR